MRTIVPATFTGSKAWAAVDIERISDATIRLHWTDRPYQWHVNDGPEVFVVLDVSVDMHTQVDGVEKSNRRNVGDIFHARDGGEHVAHPAGQARVLVIERAGSI